MAERESEWIGTRGAVIIGGVMDVNAPRPASTASLFGRARAEVDRSLSEREDVACPLCRMSPRRFAVDYQGLHLARCASCGLEFQSPRPVFEQLVTAVYGASYHRPDDWVADTTRQWHFERQLSQLAQDLPAGRRTLLDVGCGAGAFIRFSTLRGWSVDGTDVVMTDRARDTRARLWEGQLPAIEFGESRFDVVRFNQVLEHTQDPLAELRRARELVTSGGLMCIGVPNLAGLSARLKSWQSRLHLKRKPWKHYSALHHLWYFTPRTLGRLVEAAGFDVVQWETPVAGRPGRPEWVTALVRVPFEGVRCGAILDLYARAR